MHICMSQTRTTQLIVSLHVFVCNPVGWMYLCTYLQPHHFSGEKDPHLVCACNPLSLTRESFMPDDDAQQPSLAVPVAISRNFSKQDNKLARRRLRRSRERAMSLLHTSCSLVLKKIRIQFYFTSIVPHSLVLEYATLQCNMGGGRTTIGIMCYAINHSIISSK